MKKTVKGILSALMALSMVGCSSTSTSTGDGKFKAGTYTGTGKGNNGDITVEVTLSSDAITDIKITDQNETAGISDDAITNIPKEIIDAQSVSVDTVSGATNS